MVMPVLAAVGSALSSAPVIGSVISGISSLFGSKKSKDAASEAAMQNYLAQKEFAQHGIRWKVEDAKAAGLHPLFALGGSGATFSPSFTVGGEGAGVADAGQHLGRAVTAALQPSEKAIQDAQLAALASQSRRDDAQAALFASQAARIAQERIASRSIGIGSMEDVLPVYQHQSQPGVVEIGPIGQSKIVRPEQFVHQPGGPDVIAGQHPAFMETTVGKSGVTLMLPHSGGQMMEETPLTLAPSFVAANVERYGWNGFLGRWLAGRSKLVEARPWDKPLIDAIDYVINLQKRRRQ